MAGDSLQVSATEAAATREALGSFPAPTQDELTEITAPEAASAPEIKIDAPTPEMKKEEEKTVKKERNVSAQSEEYCLELADGVINLIRKLGPLRRIMTNELKRNMLELEVLAEDLKDSLDDESSVLSTEYDDDDDDEPFPKSLPVPPSLEQQNVCRIQQLTMDAWKSGTHIVHPNSAIIQAYYHRLHEPAANQPLSQSSTSSKLRQAQAEMPSDSKNLQRVMICSRIIHTELERIISVPVPFPIFMAPPFKVIVHFLPQLRQRLIHLETEFKDVEANSTNTPTPEPNESAKGKVGEENGTNTDEITSENSVDPDAQTTSIAKPDPYGAASTVRGKVLSTSISHLKLLLNFVDEEIRDTINLRAEIAAGTLKTILFEDLWHLFQPGDVILSPRGPNKQLLKVCAVTGGQVQLRNHSREESEHLNRLREQTRAPVVQIRSVDSRLHDIMREEASGLGIWTPFTIDCYTMAFDGTEVGPLDFCKRIKHYSGKRLITDLNVYPLRFHPNSDELLQKMEQRGRKVLSSYGHKRYNGATINHEGDETMEDIRSDIFIDMKTYYDLKPQFGPGMPPPPPPNRMKTLGQLLKTKPNLTETSENLEKNRWLPLSGHEVDTKLSEDYMAANRGNLQPTKSSEVMDSPQCLQLIQYPVIGYAFRYRKWFALDIDLVEDIDLERESRESGFNELVIPKRYRDLLVALVDNHVTGAQIQPAQEEVLGTDSKNNQIDLVKGKGQGVIILLHGPPGSGKTSTAETIAAYTQRPLYSLTCGDIGINPREAEYNLIDHTRRANKWSCVLLLDEADVFLMQRDWHKMERNALVSVFLRELEYYSGILFLTTNRPGVLDEAFKSRIHITLRYPSVDLESTKTMWMNIIRRLEQDNETNDVKVVFSRDELLDFAERHYRRYERDGATWNGRQIRNAFRTALALGHHQRLQVLRDNDVTPAQAAKSGKKKWMSVKLTKANFQKIAKTAHEFEEYIVALRGKDSDNVRDAEVRDDVFDIIALGEAMQQARKDYGAAAKGKKNMATISGGTEKKGLTRAGGSGKAKKGRLVSTDCDDEDEDNEGDDNEDEDENELSDED